VGHMWATWTDIARPVAVPNEKLVLGSPWVNLLVTWLVLMFLLGGPGEADRR